MCMLLIYNLSMRTKYVNGFDGMGYVILLWHSLSLLYNYFEPAYIVVKLDSENEV